jgi:hypothetical protein
VVGGGWASSGADEEGRGAAMELRSTIMSLLGPTAEAVAMTSWLRHRWAGAIDRCASSWAGGDGWASPDTADGGCPSSSPGGGGWPMPVPAKRAGTRRPGSSVEANGLRPGPARSARA